MSVAASAPNGGRVAFTLPKKAFWVLPVIAVMMLALTLTPAEIWRAPVNDATYTGFDPNLVYANAASGSVAVSRESIEINAPPAAHPYVNLATTVLPKLTAALDVSVAENSADVPLRIALWSPWTNSGEFLIFGPAPLDQITSESVMYSTDAPIVNGTVSTKATVLANYVPGSKYHLAVVVDKPSRTIAITVSSSDGTKHVATMDPSVSPTIFGAVQVSLSAFTFAGAQTSRVTLSNYSITFPHQRAWAAKVMDPREQFIFVALALLGLLSVAIAVAVRLPSISASLARLGGVRVRLGLASRARKRAVLLIAGAIGVYLVGNALLIPLGGHPFDFATEKLYAYVARTYGPTQLYFLPNAVSLPALWRGIPFVESAFPYEPVVAYLFSAVGWSNSLLFAGGGAFSPGDLHLDYLIKGTNVLFGLGDSALIYLILRRLGTSSRLSLIAAGLFLFNPAVWFSMSIWGQTHVISLFLVLAAVLMAERNQPSWAWLALVAATLTRPQMLVFALVLGIVFLKKFSPRQNVAALSWTIIVTFLLLAPLTLATSPSLPIDIAVHNFSVQAGGGNARDLTTVSQDAYSVWPLVTYLAHGTSGPERAFTPSSNLLVGSLSYQRLGQLLTLAALLLVVAVLIARRRITDHGAYLPLVTLAITSFLMLLTGVVATHFLLALPFLLLCRRWLGGVAYYYLAAIWTVTTFVPMFGDMGNSIRDLNYPVLSPAHNAITNSIVNLYSWDRFITVSVVANVGVLIWVGWLAVRRPARMEIEAC